MVGTKALISIIIVIVCSFISKSLIGYRQKEQLQDVFPVFLLSLFMGGVIYSIQYLGMTDISTLFLQITIGTILYFGLAYVLKYESLKYVIASVKTYLHKK